MDKQLQEHRTDFWDYIDQANDAPRRSRQRQVKVFTLGEIPRKKPIRKRRSNPLKTIYDEASA